MLEKELSFADLSISLSELYEAMGYADAVPDEAVEKEVRGVLGRVEAVTSPRFCFFISGGELDESKDSLSVGDTCFSIGKIITRQLRGSESFAFFAATAGTGFERFQHTLQQEGDMVKGGGIPTVSVPDIAAGMCRSKRNYSLYFLQRNLAASG